MKDLNQANGWLSQLQATLFHEARKYAETEKISFVLAVGVMVQGEFLILSLGLHPEGDLSNLELINDTYEQCKGVLFSRCEPTFESVVFDNFGDSKTRVCISTSSFLSVEDSPRNQKFEEWKRMYFSP